MEQHIDDDIFFYAQQGWTQPIIDLLRPLFWLPWHDTSNDITHRPDGSIRDYIRFQGLTSDHAAQVMTMLPSNAWGDRQNNGPTLITTLNACLASDGDMELSGYVITQARFDERISVDGLMCYHDDLVEPHMWTSEQRVWEKAVTQMGIVDALAPSDEIAYTHSPVDDQRYGWWLWWD